MPHRASMGLLPLLAWGLACALGVAVHAEPIDARLRFAWGGNVPQPWSGTISISDGALAQLQPLGAEADEAAALQLDGRRIVVKPLMARTADGCDVTIRADSAAAVNVILRNNSQAHAEPVVFPLQQLVDGPCRVPLDEFGGYLSIARAPGDELRVNVQREHLVFAPEETLRLAVEPRIVARAAGPISLEAKLYGHQSSEILWQSTILYDPAVAAPLPIELAVPRSEGSYRLRLALVTRPEGFAARLAPWDKSAELTSRNVAFVVVDPAARLPRLNDAWDVVSVIDATSSSWWQRLPQWTQVEKLPGFKTPRPLGNVKPLISPIGRSFVELPPTSPSDDLAWQAYLLPVRDVGQPHAVEIETPRAMRQHLAVSIVETDAAGRATTFGRDWGVADDGRASTGNEGVDVHRIVFWPRTKSPTVVIANRSHLQSALYGKIKLLRRGESATAPEATVTARPRIAAAYIADPRLAATFGGRGELDSSAGREITTWHAFLTAANRLAQQLVASGYNGAVVSIAADGASLAPVEGLGNSTRFDTGMLAATADDPLPKDVLEVLLRVFDREGLTLTPAVKLAAPLPALESLRAASGGERAYRWIGPDGRAWHECSSTPEVAAPHYNLLHRPVQAELASLIERIAARYDAHAAWGGLAIQLDGAGYGVLPGLAWGVDDETALAFAEQSQVPTPLAGEDRYRQRGELLLGSQLPQWKAWRRTQTTSFYRTLARRIASRRPDARLILCTEELFAGRASAERLRLAVSGRASLEEAIDETGIDLAELAATPEIVLLRPRRLRNDESVDAMAADMRINQSSELDQLFAHNSASGEIFYHVPALLELPSFDQQSPFGVAQTRLSAPVASTLAGDAALRALAVSLTARDFPLIVSGSGEFPLVDNPRHRDALRVFQELPAAGNVRVERRQPVTMRLYQEVESAAICLVNESPWPVELTIPLQADGTLVWRRLGIDPAVEASRAAVDPELTGTLAASRKEWSLTLAPYGIAARRFSSPHVRIGAWAPKISPEARQALARRVAEFEQRMSRLDDERPYAALQNPGFELAGDAGQMLGWQPRIGAVGAVELSEETEPVTGRSLHLKSEDALGVAVQSHLFPIPSTGQLLVRARIRAAGLQPSAQLYAWFEYESGGVARQRYVALGAGQPLDGPWRDVEFAADELPMASDGQMRIQFHLVGEGEAWVDDVRMYDLRFTKDQRFQISKRLYAAKTALDEGQLMDCQRLIDGYWPRMFVEQTETSAIASRPPEVGPTRAAALVPTERGAEAPGISERLRGMAPRILR
jgi:hypothetical protein